MVDLLSIDANPVVVLPWMEYEVSFILSLICYMEEEIAAKFYNV